MRWTTVTFSILVFGIFPIVSLASQKQQCLLGAVGDSVTIPLNYPKLSADDHIHWKHEELKIINRKNKTKSDRPLSVGMSGSLRLEKLLKTDSGKYEAEIYAADGKLKTSKSSCLNVLEKVCKPTVKQTCSGSDVILTCNIPDQENSTFEWRKSRQIIGKKGTTLKLKTKDIKPEDVFSCSAKNDVSQEISEETKVNCSDPNAPNKFPFMDNWIMYSIIAAAGALAIILIVVLLVCVCQRKRQRLHRQREEEELRLASLMQQPPCQSRHPAPLPVKGKPGSWPHPTSGGHAPQPPRTRPKGRQRPPPPVVNQMTEEQPPPLPRPRQTTPRQKQ